MTKPPVAPLTALSEEQRAQAQSRFASIHRQICTIALERGWPTPGYDKVRQVIKKIDPALVTLAHEGAAAYREEFDLLYR